MRRLSVSVGFVVLLALAIAACNVGSGGGGSSSGGSTLSLGASSFTGATDITITAGQAVTFDDSSGGTHDLVTGTNGQFTAATGAPNEFSTKDGLDLSAGDKKTITFANAGTYQITCTIHPSMQAKITVTAAGSGYGY
jgi:plastocyanin